MANYSLIIKKGKYQLVLSTSDRELVSEQFELWVREAGEYAKQKKIHEHKDNINTQIKAEEEVTKKHIEEQIHKPAEEVIAKDETLKEDKKDDSANKDLDIFYSVPAQGPGEEEETGPQAEPETGVFDAILDNSMKNPQTELSFKPNPSINKDNAFINFMGDKKIEKKIDYLLLTAYYFSQYEQKPRFTLKQLNSKLMQNLAVIIDHSVLQEAIKRDYIECLPDLTGIVGASEYRLTAYGEKNILDA